MCTNKRRHTPDARKITRACGREKELLQCQNGSNIAHAVFDDTIAEFSEKIFLYQVQTNIKRSKFLLIYTTFDGGQLDSNSVFKLQKQLKALSGWQFELKFQSSIPPIGSGKYAWLIKNAD